jgi:hypothetical protein
MPLYAYLLAIPANFYMCTPSTVHAVRTGHASLSLPPWQYRLRLPVLTLPATATTYVPGVVLAPGGSWDGTPLSRSASPTYLTYSTDTTTLRYCSTGRIPLLLCSTYCIIIYTNERYFCLQKPHSASPVKKKTTPRPGISDWAGIGPAPKWHASTASALSAACSLVCNDRVLHRILVL